MINSEVQELFHKKIRNLQEEFDNKILKLKKEFYNSQIKSDENKSIPKIVPVNNESKFVKKSTFKNISKTFNNLQFVIENTDLYNNMKAEFNKDEDFVSYNHIMSYYYVYPMKRDHLFQKIVFDHFNRLPEFFNNNDLLNLNYKPILDGIGVKVIEGRPNRKEYKYKPISFGDLEKKLQYYYSTNNRKWFTRYWNLITGEYIDKFDYLNLKYKPMLEVFKL
jgi:hypothetical protein